jgi:hypothetical protein
MADIVTDDVQNKRPTLAGDWRDDDAYKLNLLVQSEANPPDAAAEPIERITELPVAPRKKNRMLTSSMTIRAGQTLDAFQALPSDPDRLEIVVRVYSATATDQIRVSDDAAKVQADGAAFLVRTGFQFGTSGGLDGDCFTGPIWIGAVAPTTDLVVTILAITV